MSRVDASTSSSTQTALIRPAQREPLLSHQIDAITSFRKKFQQGATEPTELFVGIYELIIGLKGGRIHQPLVPAEVTDHGHEFVSRPLMQALDALNLLERAPHPLSHVQECVAALKRANQELWIGAIEARFRAGLRRIDEFDCVEGRHVLSQIGKLRRDLQSSLNYSMATSRGTNEKPAYAASVGWALRRIDNAFREYQKSDSATRGEDLYQTVANTEQAIDLQNAIQRFTELAPLDKEINPTLLRTALRRLAEDLGTTPLPLKKGFASGTPEMAASLHWWVSVAIKTLLTRPSDEAWGNLFMLINSARFELGDQNPVTESAYNQRHRMRGP